MNTQLSSNPIVGVAFALPVTANPVPTATLVTVPTLSRPGLASNAEIFAA